MSWNELVPVIPALAVALLSAIGLGLLSVMPAVGARSARRRTQRWISMAVGEQTDRPERAPAAANSRAEAIAVPGREQEA